MNYLKELQKKNNDDHFEKNKTITYEGNIHHDYFRRIPFEKLIKLLIHNNIDLNNKKLLIASCGNGIDIFYLKKYYKNNTYYATDISKKAVDFVLSQFNDVQGDIQDNESLSFEDNSFDYSYVAAALHHLPRPLLGLYELLRVAKYGVISIEPNDSFLMRFATKIGLAKKVEEDGNYVYRFNRRDIERISNSLFIKNLTIRFWAFHYQGESRVIYLILRIINYILNRLISNQGNYIVYILLKQDVLVSSYHKAIC